MEDGPTALKCASQGRSWLFFFLSPARSSVLSVVSYPFAGLSRIFHAVFTGTGVASAVLEVCFGTTAGQGPPARLCCRVSLLRMRQSRNSHWSRSNPPRSVPFSPLHDRMHLDRRVHDAPQTGDHFVSNLIATLQPPPSYRSLAVASYRLFHVSLSCLTVVRASSCHR